MSAEASTTIAREAVLLTREEEHRMNELNRRLESGQELSDSEQLELAQLKQRYHAFLLEGERRLREGARLRGNSGEDDGSLSDSLTKAGKAAWFWGSLIATAVPGYLGKKAGITADFLHWNFITDLLILGAIPVVTQVGSSGNHLQQLATQLEERQVRLGMVVACLEQEEMEGFGVSVIQFAQEAQWKEYMGDDVAYVHVPMADTTANVPFDVVANAVTKMSECVRLQHRGVYVHCKAGKGRSWMVLICYLTTFGGMMYEEATALAQSKRGQINPSPSQEMFARDFPLRFAKWKSMQDAILS